MTLVDIKIVADILNLLNTKTTGVINASTVQSFVGNAADINDSYEAYNNGSISGLGNEVSILLDDTLQVSVLNALDENTTGIVIAFAIKSLSGNVEDLIKAYNSYGIIGLGDESIILSNIHTLEDLKAINNATSGAITLYDNTVALSGTSADLLDAFTGTFNSTYTGSLTITDASGTNISAADLAAIGSATTGTVTATNGIAISGTGAEVTAVLITEESKVNIASPTTADISDSITVSNASAISQTNNITANFSGGVVDTIANLTSSGSITDDLVATTNDDKDVNITIIDDETTSVKATELSSIGHATTGKVTVSNAIEINGTTAELIGALITDATKVIASIANLSISDTPTPAQLSALDAVTTGKIIFLQVVEMISFSLRLQYLRAH